MSAPIDTAEVPASPARRFMRGFSASVVGGFAGAFGTAVVLAAWPAFDTRMNGYPAGDIIGTGVITGTLGFIVAIPFWWAGLLLVGWPVGALLRLFRPQGGRTQATILGLAAGPAAWLFLAGIASFAGQVWILLGMAAVGALVGRIVFNLSFETRW